MRGRGSYGMSGCGMGSIYESRGSPPSRNGIERRPHLNVLKGGKGIQSDDRRDPKNKYRNSASVETRANKDRRKKYISFGLQIVS